jgi:hypothetical protein
VTQPSDPYPPDRSPPVPYYHPNAYRPPDPAAPARKASILMWVLAVVAVLLGIVMAALVMPMLELALQSATPAEADQIRQQIAQAEAGRQVPMGTQLLVGGTVLIAAGGVMGFLAFFVRRGGLGAAVSAAVLTGLAIGYFVLNLVAGVALNPGQAPAVLCFTIVPVGLLGLQMAWLVQAARNAPAVAARRQSPTGNDAPGHDARGAGSAYPPTGGGRPGEPLAPPPTGPAAPRQPPVSGPYSIGSSPAGSPGLFGPAPFGIPPPPPDDTPAGRYGYATRPPAGGTGDATAPPAVPPSPPPPPNS